jgi:hypothetical protein
MSMSSVRRIGQLAAVCATVAMPSSAAGQVPDTVHYFVDIDCSARGITNDGTQSLYNIIGLSDDGEEISFTENDLDKQRLTNSDCLDGVPSFFLSLPDSVRIRTFRIELLGQHMDDALFLDSLEFAMLGPDVEDAMGWDVDGKEGWCLSAAPNDRSGDWRGRIYEDICFPCLEFSIVPLREDEPIVDGDWRRTAFPGYAECRVPDEDAPPG